ncbi:hypothetical protein [Stakelama marina]|uniref:Inner membrane protein n=1 Tax=Stakelama marina TaxID=2826939 RepID=A0A8T4IG57_9SPHN|nr:hypothetical protein [Stakelama marina]MBR0553022.1 hypothetical protein [Stakelama marina]
MTTDSDAFRTGPTRNPTMRTIAITGAIAFLIGLAVMAAAIAMFGDRWLDAAPRRAAPVEKAAETTPPDQGEDLNTSGLERLAAREAALDQRIEALESRLSNVDSSSRVASTFANRAEGLMVAFAARRALDRGLPLGYIEGQLRERFGSVRPRAVATVISAARTPTTLEDLRLALDRISPRLTAASPDAGWWDALRSEIGTLVVIRKDTTPSPRPEERLRRASRMLDAGQVEGALAEVARMPGADQADSWMKAARRYINARRALDAIETTAIEGGGVQPQPKVTQPSDAGDAVTSGPPAPPATVDGQQQQTN